jgi:hypothetical protein
MMSTPSTTTAKDASKMASATATVAWKANILIVRYVGGIRD